MFMRASRRKPINVCFESRANRTARLLGAEMAATIGMPPASAFCSISNEARPLNSRIVPDSGSRLASNKRWFDYTGATPEQVEGWGWQAFHDPSILPGVIERFSEAV